MNKKFGILATKMMLALFSTIILISCEKTTVPSVNTLDKVTAITNSTAKSGGNITSDGGAKITVRGVCWGTNKTPTIADNKTTDGTGDGEFSSNLSGLSPGTTYYVRAYATNSSGTGYGNAVAFTTEKPSIPIVNTLEEVTSITKNTAKSGGNITSDGGATVTARGVCWSTNETPTIADNKTTDGSGTGEFSSNLSGLTPGTTYYVRAYATNSNGTGYGNAISFKTEIAIITGSFTDPRDGNVYKTVTIGTQVWMAENLKYLPSVVSYTTESYTEPYYYVYGFYGSNVASAKATVNYTTFGVLYNFPAALIACPAGWHLPTSAEWGQLITYLGGDTVAGGKMKEAGTSHWLTPNTNATNESGFTALPAGGRGSSGFNSIGEIGYWWTSTETSSHSYWSRGVNYSSGTIDISGYYPRLGLSVRCVKD